ncbi:HemK family protein methyltransferase [Candidatus Kaiserbacteria bacterium]|nr:HemK family protein methyltransferase [Candidatus Kaiserbacteria bacterium]NCT01711.1 HemK family protein methyltransferase [Candidatus Parcubacteria bacterium]
MEYIQTLCLRLLTEKYQGNTSESYQQDCDRLKKGEPYEYVLGHVDFLGAKIDLSLHPMIPRPETAFWVEKAIVELKGKPGPLRLADIFAGSGNVGIALLTHLPNATVDISELDPMLKEQIEKNIILNTIAPERVHVISASVIEGLTGEYDAIFAVPPYVPYVALPELDQEMIEFEPHLAFFAHEDGHEFHRALIQNTLDFLTKGGTLYMEADMDHNEAIKKLVKGTQWSKLEFWSDPYGATPNVVLRKE